MKKYWDPLPGPPRYSKLALVRFYRLYLTLTISLFSNLSSYLYWKKPLTKPIFNLWEFFQSRPLSQESFTKNRKNGKKRVLLWRKFKKIRFITVNTRWITLKFSKRRGKNYFRKNAGNCWWNREIFLCSLKVTYLWGQLAVTRNFCLFLSGCEMSS